MTFDEALEAAVLGSRVRCDALQAGAWVDYQFSGWRRCFPGGSSCQFLATPAERSAVWEEVPVPAPVRKWGKPVPCAVFTGPEADEYHKSLPPIVPKRDKWGRPVC